MKPKTQYTKSGRINIAYQVFGSGDRDLVYIPGWISNIDLMWACPQLVQFLTDLSKVVRIILFDKRGTGLSDRVADLSPLEERMDDIRAVMDAVGCQKAFLFGHSEGGSVSALFSATYPERTLGLISFGMFAKRRWSKDYPWAPTDAERQEVYTMIEDHWGSGQMDLVSLAPSMKDDQVFMDWLASYFRSGASPSAALVLTKMNTQVDIIDILDTIEVPTLLMFRSDDIDVKVEEGEFIFNRIKGSEFVEFPGHDHLFWVGDSKIVLDEMIDFISKKRDHKVFGKVLSTILKLKMRDFKSQRSIYSIEHLDKKIQQVDEIISNKISQYRGRIVEANDKDTIATFDGPSKAVHCAIEIRHVIHQFGLNVTQGIHIGECMMHGKDLGGRAVNITGAILSSASVGDILISSTVYNLLSGTGLEFDHKDHIPVFDNSLVQTMLLSDSTQDIPIDESRLEDKETQKLVKNHSFLEDVLQSIEDHLTDEHYSVQVLCKEMVISERQLQRKLKLISNKSPNQLIRSVRLHRAKEMLQQQSKSVSEAAFCTGFSSLSYFTRSFKKEFGFSPSLLNKNDD